MSNSEQNQTAHPIESVMETAMEHLRSMVDANTVIGDPILTQDGSTIIPVSKISIGFVSGGSDFATKTNPKLCFGGGGGAGLTMTPISFLVISSSGAVNMLPVNQNTVTGLDKALDMAPEMVEKIKDLFRKDKIKD